MSKSGRGDDSEVRLKQQEIEQKRARGAISCAECRRLKLKCDKSVPCGSCRRRGCESICPNGKLVTGHGTRFVLADTDRLHKKMADMSERIRQLEDALSIAQSSLSHEPHPLLSADKMKIKSNLEMHAAVNEDNDAGFGPNGQNESDTDYIDAFGTLAVHEDGGSTFYGRSAGSESLMIGTEDGPPTPLASASRDAATILPPDIAHYSSSLPLALGPLPPMSFQDMIRRYLPHWERARELADIYEEYEIWFFQAVTRRQLEEQLLPMFYVEAPRSTTSLPRPGPHDLAVVFVVFCLGAIFDRNRPAPPERNAESELYYHLSRAALNLQPILEHPSSLSTVQTFSTLAIYQALTCDDNAIEGLWANMGLATKLAQSIGLHRDCARWGLSNLEIHARRCLFWEVCTTDCWVSLATGRIQSFPIAHVDCELALDPDQTLSEDGQVQSSLPAWKARFGAKCLSVLAASLTAKVPKYSTILDIDRQFRDMELPHFAQGGVPQNVGLSATMQYFMPQNYTRYAMMYLHRVFFAQALVDRTGDPLKSPYAPSFLAGYRAACETVSLLRQQFDLFPLELARVWVLWTHAFSATFMITSVVTHASRSKVAQSALEEMDKARALFEDAARIGGRAVKFVPKVRHFFEKAHQAFYASQGQDVRRPDIFSPRGADEDKEKLHIFLGRTNKVSTKSASSPPMQHEPSPPPVTQVQESSVRYDYDPNMHPHLARELNEFGQQFEDPSFRQPVSYEPRAYYEPQSHASGSYNTHHHHYHSTGHQEPSASGHHYVTPPPRSNSQGHSSSSASPVDSWAHAHDIGISMPVLLQQQHTHQPPIQHPYSMHQPPSHPQASGHLPRVLPPRLNSPPLVHYDSMPRELPVPVPPALSTPQSSVQPEGGLQEMWTSFMQQAELPTAPTQFPFSGPGVRR